MTESATHRDHHYVPRVYLKRWGKAHGWIWLYRTLVSHPKVPLWKKNSIRGIAYHSHLYTRIVAGRENDEIERWLDREIESPAEEALHKAVSGARLTPVDWKRLIRFLAAQDVRTPVRLLESFQRWGATLPKLIEETVQKSVCELEVARESGAPLAKIVNPSIDQLPFRVTTEIVPDQKFGRLKAEMLAGRSLWLYEIRHLLTQTVNILYDHKWTIISPPDDLTWFTSDNPVVRLNYYGRGKYDLKGGWGIPRTDIFLPLSPHHLLYTQVGERPPVRGEICPRDQAEAFRHYIAENAHRMIIAVELDRDVPKLRPRLVNAAMLRDESERWRRWNEDQSMAEREFMGGQNHKESA